MTDALGRILLGVTAFALAGCDAVIELTGKQDAGAGPGCAASTPMDAPNPPESPFFVYDPLGPLVDVTCDWTHYQPAEAFCVRIDAPEFTPGGTGPLSADGTDPACAFSGFGPEVKGLYKVVIPTPILCPGCRRLFLDFANTPPDRPDLNIYRAHGHAFYRIMSGNLAYTIEPIAHSPNTKNFTNDKLVAPAGSPLEQLIGAADSHFQSYVTGTRFFAHTGVQGPYYIGPWYVNRDGVRIHGVYVDVNVVDATPIGDPDADAIRYMAAFNSGQITCVDNLTPGTSGGNLLYGGCFDRFGGSTTAWNPF